MKRCTECAEEVQDAAVVCRFCGHRFDGRPAATQARSGGSGCQTAIGAIIALVIVLWLLNRAGGNDQPAPAAPLAPALAASTVKQCRDLLAEGARKGLIKARPAPNRLNVEDMKWSVLPAKTKDEFLQAVACDVWQRAMPGDTDHVVVYGYRSGKRLQMLTSVGMARE